MKKIFSLLFFTLLIGSAFAQVDTLSPEKKVQYRIQQLQGQRINALPDFAITKALQSIAEMSAGRTPKLSMKDLREGKADTSSVIQLNEKEQSGTFRYVPGSVRPDDSVMTIKVGSKSYDRIVEGHINVKWFGAKGDGVSIDNNAIDKAIRAAKRKGSTIFFPAGTYLINRTINVPRGITIRGEGIWDANSSTIKLANGANSVMLQSGTGDQRSFLGLENIKFDGNGINQTAENDALRIWDQFVGSWLKNVSVVNVYGTGLSINGSDLQMDHVWVLSTCSSSGYGIDINPNFTTGQKGSYNFDHLYVEWTRRNSVPYFGYDASIESYRGPAMRINRASSVNINELHFEYVSDGIEFYATHNVNINMTAGYDIGKTGETHGLFVSTTDLAFKSFTAQSSEIGVVKGDLRWMEYRGYTPQYFGYIKSVSEKPYMNLIKLSNSGVNPGVLETVLPNTSISNSLNIIKTGTVSPQQIRSNIEAGATPKSHYWKTAGRYGNFGSDYSVQGMDVDLLTLDFAGSLIDINGVLRMASKTATSLLTNTIALTSITNNGAGYAVSRGSGSTTNVDFLTAVMRAAGSPNVSASNIGHQYFNSTTKRYYNSISVGNGAGDWQQIPVPAEPSNDTASNVSATYTQGEVQAIIDELRDLKIKLRASGALKP